MTYIPKQTKLTRERVEAKLDVALIEELELYCRYLESDRDYVVSQALELVFRKDKGFRHWLSNRPTTGNAPGNTAAEAASSKARRNGRAGEVTIPSELA